MADIYVNRSTGDDRNAGTRALPLKTILRATELAARVAGDTGTISVAAGVYDLDNGENFPLLVPPGYALEGESRSDRPIIRFTGQAREPSGARVPFWNATVLVAGAAVRRVVLESDPVSAPPACTAILGIVANQEDVILEGVEVRARSLRRDDGFAVSISGHGNRASVSLVRVHAGGAFFWEEGACTLQWSRFEGSTLVALGEGHHVVSYSDFTDSGIALVSSSDARVQFNVFHDVTWGGGAIVVHGAPGSSDDGPFIERNTIRDCVFGIVCEGPGTARFRRNTIERFQQAGVRVTRGASPVFEDANRVQAPLTPFSALLRTERDASPAFEATIFDSRLPAASSGYTHALTGLFLHSPVDFGGGARSRGNNSFGRVYSVPEADIPGGGLITAHNNLWPPPHHYCRDYFCAAPGTVVEYDGGRLDPEGWRPGR